jgi:type VII secretion protein EccB
MWSRRDQLQAYQFLRRRLVSAVLLGDANHPESPSRRSVMSTVTGVVVTLLLLAGIGIWGAVTQSTAADWRTAGQVIVEKDNYALFVLGDQDQGQVRLHPALNYASALLFLGRPGPIVTLPRSALADAPMGRPVGIPGAPQTLPAATALLVGPWTACARTSTGVAGRVDLSVNLSLGQAETGQELPADGALLVQDAGPAGSTYLVTEGRRFAVASLEVARILGFTATPLPVGTAWINSLPAGPPLHFLTEPTDGEGAVVGGISIRTGQVITVSDPGRAPEFFVYRADGLSRVSETEARLITINPTTRDRSPILTRTQAAALKQSPQRLDRPDVGYPDRVPSIVQLNPGPVALCATAPPDPAQSQVMRITVRATVPPQGTPTGAQPLATHLADDVTVPANRGAVAVTWHGDGRTSQTTYLVADDGRRYLIPSAKELGILGYAGHGLAMVSDSLMAMLPQGPALDQEAARAEAEWSAVASPRATQPSAEPTP